MQIAPSHEGLELGIGDSILVKVWPCLEALSNPCASHCVLLGLPFALPQPLPHLVPSLCPASCDASPRQQQLPVLAGACAGHGPLIWHSRSRPCCSAGAQKGLKPPEVVTCLQALAQATGKSMQKVKVEYDKEGDLGTVAANARSSQKTMFQSAPLTVRAVFK